jgi:hypothetical protein
LLQAHKGCGILRGEGFAEGVHELGCTPFDILFVQDCLDDRERRLGSLRWSGRRMIAVEPHAIGARIEDR